MTESEFIRHEPCPDCGSSDALAIYTDGHTFCFSCQTRTAGFKADDPNVTPDTTPASVEEDDF